MLPELSKLLNYKHEKIIKSYMRTYHVDERRATELFEDMLRYLWVSNKHNSDCQLYPEQEHLTFQCVMHEEMRDIDNMWHNFILYTNDYTQFCVKYFGDYIHHVPDIAESIVQTNKEFSVDLEKYLNYVYDHLGEEVVRRWFSVHLASGM